MVANNPNFHATARGLTTRPMSAGFIPCRKLFSNSRCHKVIRFLYQSAEKFQRLSSLMDEPGAGRVFLLRPALVQKLNMVLDVPTDRWDRSMPACRRRRRPQVAPRLRCGRWRIVGQQLAGWPRFSFEATLKRVPAFRRSRAWRRPRPRPNRCRRAGGFSSRQFTCFQTWWKSQHFDWFSKGRQKEPETLFL